MTEQRREGVGNWPYRSGGSGLGAGGTGKVPRTCLGRCHKSLPGGLWNTVGRLEAELFFTVLPLTGPILFCAFSLSLLLDWVGFCQSSPSISIS